MVLLGEKLSLGQIEVDSAAIRAFDRGMAELGHPPSRVRAMSDYVSAVTRCPIKTFNLADLAEYATVSKGTAQDRYRHLLERAPWPEREIALALIRAATTADVLALSIEIDVNAQGDERGRDLLVVAAIGDGVSIPLGWGCIDYPPVVPGVPGAIRDALLHLLEEVEERWHLFEKGPLPPLVSADACFGEDQELRSALRGRGFEYVLPVPADYDEVELLQHPYASTAPNRTIAELLSGIEAGSSALELAADERSESEYAHTLRRGVHALIHPEIATVSGGLLGHLPRLRAEELGDLQPPEPSLIRDLRVAGLLRGSPKGAIRHAWLMSAYAMACRGRLSTPRGTS